MSEALAEGQMEATLFLGKIYGDGLGLRQNSAKAWEYYEIAHSAKLVEGTYQLAKLIEKQALESPEDSFLTKKFMELYSEAAKAEHSDALCDLGFLLEKESHKY